MIRKSFKNKIIQTNGAMKLRISLIKIQPQILIHSIIVLTKILKKTITMKII